MKNEILSKEVTILFLSEWFTVKLKHKKRAEYNSALLIYWLDVESSIPWLEVLCDLPQSIIQVLPRYNHYFVCQLSNDYLLSYLVLSNCSLSIIYNYVVYTILWLLSQLQVIQNYQKQWMPFSVSIKLLPNFRCLS